jgi:acetyltransferase-like isoleucine patch superfamily enzyme
MSEKPHGAVQKQLSQPGSTIKKYQQSVTGDNSFIELIIYEGINLLCMSSRGSLGRRIRRICLALISGHIGKHVQIGTNNLLLQPKKLHVEDYVKIGDDVTFGIKTTGDGIVIRANVTVDDRTIFNCSGATITIGKGTWIKNDCRLGSLRGLTVGEYCIIGQYTCISGAGHSSSELHRPIIEQPLVSKGHTIIEDNVQIGKRVTILDGVRVGNNSIIADDSLVNKDIPPNSRVSGTPARSSC